MATEYGVIVKAIPDTNSFDEDLNKKLKGKKREIDINVAVSEEAIKKLNNIDERFNQIKRTVQTGFKVKIEDDGTTRKLTEKIENLKNKLNGLSDIDAQNKIREKISTLSKELNDYKERGEEVLEVTQQFKDKLGETQTVVTYLTEEGKILNSEVVKSTKNIEEAGKATDKLVEKSIKEREALEQKNQKLKETNILYQEYIKVRDENGNIVNTTIKENELGQREITQVIEKEDEKGRKIQETTNFIELQGGAWMQAGKTATKIIDDQIKKEDDYKKKIEDSEKAQEERYKKEYELYKKEIANSEKAQEERYKKEYESYKKEIERKEAEAEKNIKRYQEEQKKREEAEKKEAEAIAKKNEELKKSTIIYEENLRVRNAAGHIEEQHITKNGLGQYEMTKTIEYTDELNRKVQATIKYIQNEKGEWESVGNTSYKVLNDQIALEDKVRQKEEQRLKTITNTKKLSNEYKTVIGGLNHTISEQTEITETLGGEIKHVTTQTDSYRNILGQTVTTTTKFVDGVQESTETMVKMGKQATHLGQRFSDIIVKVAKFYLASLPIRAVQTAITNTIQAVKDFDSALTEFKKVSDLSGESLDDYCIKLERLGELTGRTRTEMVQMATEFKRSGYTDEQAANLAQISSLYQNIADEELSAADSSAVLISQMKAFQNQGLEAITVIDSINEV